MQVCWAGTAGCKPLGTLDYTHAHVVFLDMECDSPRVNTPPAHGRHSCAATVTVDASEQQPHHVSVAGSGHVAQTAEILCAQFV